MDIIALIGRMHPLLVHLPIGIILFGLVLLWRERLGRKSKGDILSLVFLAGAISATLSAISGYTLSLEGDHAQEAVVNHRNAGILLTLLSWLMWWLVRNTSQVLLQNALSVLLFTILLVTGHQGGTLTHGEGFLFASNDPVASKIRPLENIGEAVVYRDVIDPILQDKCVSCHGPEKQKGKLKLDTYEHILKGGKNGTIITAGSREKTEMLKRIMLPPDDEDHMPPKEKGQLTDEQILLIEWWIMKGADAVSTVKALEPDGTIQHALSHFANGSNEDIAATEPTLPEVKPADAATLDALRKEGVAIVPVSQGSNLLHVNLVNCTVISDTLIQNLGMLKEQLYSLKAEGPKVNNSLVLSISNCTNLGRLSLANTGITDAIANNLTSFPNLRYLNLYGTSLAGKIEKKGLTIYPQTGNGSLQSDQLVQ